MASQEERDNFFIMTLLLFRVGNQRLQEYFKTQWSIVYHRIKPGTVPPPWQDTPHDATEMKKIQPTKLRFKFKDEETKFNSGNTNVWDFSLLTTVLRYSSLDFVLHPSPEEKALDDLKGIRNTLIGHATDAAIPNAVFNAAWTDACNALTLFNATAADFKSVQDDVKKPLDVLYPMLQQCVVQEKHIQHSVDTIINRVEQLEQIVEQQHKVLEETVAKQHTTLQQTVEKQHEAVEQQHATLQQIVEQQHEAQLEVMGQIGSKFDQLLEQGLHSLRGLSTETQTDEKPSSDMAVPGPSQLSDEKPSRSNMALPLNQVNFQKKGLSTRLKDRVLKVTTKRRHCPRDSEKLKEAIRSNTEYQTKFMAEHDVTGAKTDDIFTNITVYYANKKQVKKEHAKGLSRSEQLQEYTKRSTGVKVKKCEDIFMDIKGKKPNLLLTGKPGIGKTLFCEKVIRDWSMNRLFQIKNSPKIKFAYLLKFRQLSKQGDREMNLQELLNCSTFLDDNSIIDDTLFEYLTKNPSEVLIFLDGYDEYPEHHRKQIVGDFEEKYSNISRSKMPVAALCSKLMRGKIFKNSVLLVSSRAGEAEELGEISFARHVEISGFSPEQVTEYVDKYFSEQEQTRNTVRQHVEKNENLVSFCHVPLLSFLLCWCLEWRLSQSGITENLPAKITDLYDEVLNVVAQKLHANLKYLKMSGNTMKIAQDTLRKLAKLAASLLKESKYIFEEEDMKINLTEEEIANLKISGILHCVPGIRISAFETKSEYSFIHLTLQEFLAASFFVKTKEVPEKEEATGQTYVFMSGLSSREKDGELMRKIIEQTTPTQHTDYADKLLMVQCLYEYADDEISKQTINNLYNIFSSDGWIVFHAVSDVDMKYSSYLLDIISSEKEQHPPPTDGYTLDISLSPLTSFAVGVVCDSLVLHSFITGLWLKDCSLDDKCVEKISDSVVNTGIIDLDLQMNNITDNGAKRICGVIVGDDCPVEELDLRYNDKITGKCKERVKKLVKKHKPSVELYI